MIIASSVLVVQRVRGVVVGLAAVLLGLASAAALAQNASGVALDPASSPLRCLVVPSAPIVYPAGAAEQKLGGVIRVRLTFVSADRAPRTEVFYDTVGREFKDLVLERVDQYRLPCMKAGSEAVVATQEFEFDPHDGRKLAMRPPRDDQSRLDRMFSCIKGMERPPDYPSSSLRMRSSVYQGTVLARFEFVAPDRAPRVEILLDGGNPRFAQVVREYVEGYRVPCMSASDFPIKATQPFRFRMEGEPVNLLKDAPLATFVRGLDHLDTERVRFDFKTMGCPFDLRFVAWRPYQDNVVRELGRSDPNRREFIEWLRQVQIKVPDDVRPRIAGDAMTISVPCAVLDLL